MLPLNTHDGFRRGLAVAHMRIARAVCVEVDLNRDHVGAGIVERSRTDATRVCERVGRRGACCIGQAEEVDVDDVCGAGWSRVDVARDRPVEVCLRGPADGGRRRRARNSSRVRALHHPGARTARSGRSSMRGSTSFRAHGMHCRNPRRSNRRRPRADRRLRDVDSSHRSRKAQRSAHHRRTKRCVRRGVFRS